MQKNRTLIVVLVIGVLSLCVCPLCFGFGYTGVTSLAPEVANWLPGVLLALFCVFGVGGGVLMIVWQVWYHIRARGAARRLAQAMGLQPLNEANHPLNVHYGGEHAGRAFALRVTPRISRAYSGVQERTTVQVDYEMQFMMSLKLATPQRVLVENVARMQGNGEAFGELLQGQNAERLNSTAQAALVEFVRKGYPTGLRAATLRLDRGLRRVLLCDRSAVDEQSHRFAPQVLTNSAVVLIHPHREPLISQREALAVLDDMTQLAAALEQSFG